MMRPSGRWGRAEGWEISEMPLLPSRWEAGTLGCPHGQRTGWTWGPGEVCLGVFFRAKRGGACAGSRADLLAVLLTAFFATWGSLIQTSCRPWVLAQPSQEGRERPSRSLPSTILPRPKNKTGKRPVVTLGHEVISGVLVQVSNQLFEEKGWGWGFAPTNFKHQHNLTKHHYIVLSPVH